MIDNSNRGVAGVADVIVIGAGVLGTFHAYFAAQKGYKTLLLERNTLPNDASTRNFGMIVQTIVEAEGEWADYARLTREIYDRAAGAGHLYAPLWQPVYRLD